MSLRLAIDGAIAAAILLRRYYIDITAARPWPFCRTGRPPMRGRHGRNGQTLEATRCSHGHSRECRPAWHSKYAACHGSPRTGKASSVRTNKGASQLHRAQQPLVMMRAPEIAVGMVKHNARQFRSRRSPRSISRLRDRTAGTACASENTRIQNYAARAIEALRRPKRRFESFQADGTAGANLPVCWKTWPKSRSPIGCAPGLKRYSNLITRGLRTICILKLKR